MPVCTFNTLLLASRAAGQLCSDLSVSGQLLVASWLGLLLWPQTYVYPTNVTAHNLQLPAATYTDVYVSPVAAVSPLYA